MKKREKKASSLIEILCNQVLKALHKNNLKVSFDSSFFLFFFILRGGYNKGKLEIVRHLD